MNIEQIIGWAYSYACNLVDKGIDIRTIEAELYMVRFNALYMLLGLVN